jgi:phage terminase small subunit
MQNSEVATKGRYPISRGKYSKPAKKPRHKNTKAQKDLLKSLNERQKVFCREYIYDWNATRSYLVAYPNVKNQSVAKVNGSRMLTFAHVQAYIKEIQNDLEKIAGISKLQIIAEHQKIMKGSMSKLHNTWITRREFEELTEDQKDCIAEIDTKIKTEYEFDPENPKERKPINVEYVRIKLYDKQKALDALSKLCGYDAPQKIKLDGEIKGPLMTDDEFEERLKRANKILGIG